MLEYVQFVRKNESDLESSRPNNDVEDSNSATLLWVPLNYFFCTPLLCSSFYYIYYLRTPTSFSFSASFYDSDGEGGREGCNMEVDDDQAEGRERKRERRGRDFCPISFGL